MSIDKFHSSVQAKGEKDALFAALRLLNGAHPSVVRNSDGSAPSGSWEPWAEA
jgi:hypothetical protein